jgi:hypothetical protein
MAKATESTSPLQQGIKKTSEHHRWFDVGCWNLAPVGPTVAPMDPGREHQAVQLHDAPDAFAVVAGPAGPVHHRPDAAVAVRRPAVRHRMDLLQDGLVRGAVLAAGRPAPGRVVRRAPGAAEDAADGRHRVAGHRPDSLRNDGVFFTTS